jgi:hypothetical protein
MQPCEKKLFPADTLQKISAYETAKKTLVALRQSTAPYAVPHTVRWSWNVRFWHKADIPETGINVRYWGCEADMLFCAANVRL